MRGHLSIDFFKMTCDVAPVQVEGILSDGRYFYFRARHRQIRFRVSTKSISDAVKNPDREIGFDMVGADNDEHPLSCIEPDFLIPLLALLVSVLEGVEEWETRKQGKDLAP